MLLKLNKWFPQISLAPEDGQGSASDAGAGSAPSQSSGGADDGSSSASSGASSASPSTPPSDPFEGMGQDTDDDGGVLELPATTAAPVVDTQKPAAPATTQAPEAKEAPQAEPAKQPPAPPATETARPAATSQTDQSPPLNPADPRSMAVAMQQNEPVLVDAVAQDFRLSDEELEAIQTDPGTVIPRLMARSFVRAQQNMLMHLHSIVPAMIGKHQVVAEAGKRSFDEFFSMHKGLGLDPTKHMDVAAEYARKYRAMFPDTPRDQMIRELGPLVAVAAKVTPMAAPVAAPAGRTASPPPFTPAGVGGSAAAPPQPEVVDPWAGMAQTDDD